MQTARRILIVLSLFASVSYCANARAELPPGAYESLLKEAHDVVDLKVTKITPIPPAAGDASMQHFTVEANVTGVERSKAGLKTGDTVQFGTYTVLRPMPGPMPPPKLNVGWTGRVYLNAPREGSVYELAAYGRSFVPQSAQGNLPAPGITGPGMPGPGVVGPGLQPAPDGPRLGVVARSIPGGGLEVLSIGRKTLADKLGLRPGDRVLELNGMPVSEVGDVGRALGKQADKLDVKLTREGETFELSLKR